MCAGLATARAAGHRSGMTCRELNGFLADYVDGDLMHQLRADCEDHLEHCVNCLDYLHGYRETVRLVRET